MKERANWRERGDGFVVVVELRELLTSIARNFLMHFRADFAEFLQQASTVRSLVPVMGSFIGMGVNHFPSGL